MKVILNKISDSWKEILNSARNTVNKKEIDKEPSKKFKLNLLISEHSPIRKLKIDWTWKGLKSWISVHFVRHKFGTEHFVSTQRNDRTNTNRDKSTQDTLVNHNIEANAQAIINISRKRLCFQSHMETRKAWIHFLETIKDKEPELYLVCVPECIYRFGCPEMNNCGMFKKFKDQYKDFDLSNIKKRYEKFKEIA